MRWLALALLLTSCSGYDRYSSTSVGAVSDGELLTDTRVGAYLRTEVVDPGIAIDVTHGLLDEATETTATPMLLLRYRFRTVEYLSAYVGAGPVLAHASGLSDSEAGLGVDVRTGVAYYWGDVLGQPAALFVEARLLYRDLTLERDAVMGMDEHCRPIVIREGEREDLSGEIAFLIGITVGL